MEWDWGNVYLQHDKRVFGQSCCSRDRILAHWHVVVVVHLEFVSLSEELFHWYVE